MKNLPKTLLLLLFTLLAIHSRAQTGNFKARGGDVVWEKTYPIFENVAEAKAKFQKLKAFGPNMQESSNTLVGESVLIQADLSGVDKDKLEDWVVRKDIIGKLTVLFEDGSYTVTFSEIWMRQRESTRKEPEGMKLRLKEFAYDGKNAEFEKKFLETGAAETLSKTLEDYFSLAKASINRDF